jgi:YfiR/HmsC-like
MNLLARSLIALILLLMLQVRLAVAEPSTDQIKSAYVLNFLKFTVWPSEAEEKISLCVVGNNVLGGALAALDGRLVGKRRLYVVQFAYPDSQLNSCQAIFIGESERFAPILKMLADSPVLTISDIDDFAEKGGCIGLNYREDKIIFEVNQSSVRKSNLRLPGQLLNLAFNVYGR